MTNFLIQVLLFFHPYFVSVAEVDHNAKTKSLEVSIRVFTNDFEKTLRKNYPNQKIDLIKPADKKVMDKLVKEYVGKHFNLSVDGMAKSLAYVGFEQQEESIWCYFEVEKIATLKKINITNTVLYDWQPKQENMCIVKYGGAEKTRKLGNPEGSVEFDF